MTHLNLVAPSYALLQATTRCWKCSKAICVTTVWIPCFIDNEGVEELEDDAEVGGTATLSSIDALDPETAAHIREVAPWLMPGRSKTANATYWANHCDGCGAIQGDYFVMGVNGPFLPQTRAEADALQLILGQGPLAARAFATQSDWTNWIAERLLG